ncbi:unnamed protein product [Lactuca saligna]|uniref:Uncharacterized protein n=1 Tax=Lactuca saligna TaxID=75948 RepID=A0AA35VXM4_LACSI|nr:unnamed protein product [Lactuca saligna]
MTSRGFQRQTSKKWCKTHTSKKMEDEEFKEKISTRSNLEDYIYKLKNKIKSIRSKIRSEDIEKMENAIEDIRRQILHGMKLAEGVNGTVDESDEEEYVPSLMDKTIWDPFLNDLVQGEVELPEISSDDAEMTHSDEEYDEGEHKDQQT